MTANAVLAAEGAADVSAATVMMTGTQPTGCFPLFNISTKGPVSPPWPIGSMGHPFFDRIPSLLSSLGRRSDPHSASNQHSGTGICPGHKFAGALIAVAPITRSAATVAAPLTAQPKRSHLGVTPSRRAAPLWWRATRRPPGGFGLSPFRIQVGEDLRDNVGIFDTGNDSQCSSTDRVGLDIDTEDPLEALCPHHRGAGYPRVRYWRAPNR